MDLVKDEPELTLSNKKTSPLMRLLKNAIFNSGAWGINAAVTLLSTPFIVYKLSVEGYGIYALLTSLVGYYNLMDLGIGQGVTKFVAEYRAKENQEGIFQAINGALLVQVLTGTVASLLLAILAAPILHLLRVSSQFWMDATYGIYASAIGFFFMMIADTLSATLMGLQRYDITSTTSGVINILLTILIVVALIFGVGLKGVIFLTAGTGIVMSLAYFIILRHLLPEWRLSIKLNWRLLLNLFRFSSYLFISKISNLFSNYIVRFVVSAFLGPAMVTYYVVPVKLIGAAGSLLTSSSVVLFPFASELGSQSDNARIKKLFLSGSRLFSAILIPLFLTLFVAARPILTVWMGPEFAQKGWIIMGLLALATLFGALTTVPNLVTMGLGHSRVVGIYSIINIILYGLFLPLFTSRWGIVGTAWSMLIVALPSVGLILYEAKHVIQIPMRTYLRTVLYFHLFPFVASVGLGLIIARIAFTSIIVACLVPIIYCSVYFGIMMAFGILPLQEVMKGVKEKLTLLTLGK